MKIIFSFLLISFLLFVCSGVAIQNSTLKMDFFENVKDLFLDFSKNSEAPMFYLLTGSLGCVIFLLIRMTDKKSMNTLSFISKMATASLTCFFVFIHFNEETKIHTVIFFLSLHFFTIALFFSLFWYLPKFELFQTKKSNH